MDKIAVISDIHGNMPALEAVLDDISRRRIANIYCLGDLAGKGPGSDLAVDTIRSACALTVQGNWDDFMSKDSRFEDVRWHQALLGEARLAYLRGLPFGIEFMMSGKYVRLFHASPRSLYERVQPWDDVAKRLSLFDSSARSIRPRQADIAGYGDIHNAYVQHLNGRLLFNAGSVGNPLDMTQASYAILEGEYGGCSPAPLSVQLVRVPYDIERAVRLAVEADMPQLEPYVRELRTAVYRGLTDGREEPKGGAER